jgi:3' terminal RNA ribose 2'-O-methyltransferase Hen1
VLLTLSTDHRPASDLGFLFHKHPDRVQAFELPFGTAHVFYPLCSDNQATITLMLDVDPVRLVRGSGEGEGGWLEQYVNDRPYSANSLLSVALVRVFRQAMAGISKERPDLAQMVFDWQIHLPVVPVRPGEAFLRSLFEPLGYSLRVERLMLDPTYPEWGESYFYNLDLSVTAKLSDVLTQLYVLIPVLDNDKHYFVSEDEVEKLLRFGEGWLEQHPERENIIGRALKRRHSLIDAARSRLDALLDEPVLADSEAIANIEQEKEAVERTARDPEQRSSLHEQRLERVLALLKQHKVKSVADLGCGEGRFLKKLLADSQFSRIVGLDVSVQALLIANKKLKLERQEHVTKRIELIHGALTYRDQRLMGFDAAVLIEVIEHLDEARLKALERVVFEFARPQLLIVTTPNREYNALFPDLEPTKLRHRDHRFEWTRAEFVAWANSAAERFGYSVQFEAVGLADPIHGAPSQLAVFERQAERPKPQPQPPEQVQQVQP